MSKYIVLPTGSKAEPIWVFFAGSGAAAVPIGYWRDGEWHADLGRESDFAAALRDLRAAALA